MIFFSVKAGLKGLNNNNRGCRPRKKANKNEP